MTRDGMARPWESVIGHGRPQIGVCDFDHVRCNSLTTDQPFRGTVAHRSVLRAAEHVRKQILAERGPGVLPTCYTGRCTCNFLDSLRSRIPDSVMETAIYTRNDGVVDWRYCVTENPDNDFEVPGTHIGLAFNSSVYTIMAHRLAQAHSDE